MDRTARRFWYSWAVMMGVSVILLLIGAFGVEAGAQSASQPVVVAPAAAPTAWGWFLANAGWLVPLVISVLSSVATGLSDYPKAAGVVRVLRVVVASLGVVQFRDAPGSLKAPLTPPAKP